MSMSVSACECVCLCISVSCTCVCACVCVCVFMGICDAFFLYACVCGTGSPQRGGRSTTSSHRYFPAFICDMIGVHMRHDWCAYVT